MRKLIIMLMFTIILCFATSCANQQKDTEVYSVSGENEAVIICNGMIIITDQMEKFIGGNILFKNEELLGVKEYNTRFYYHKNGERIDVLSMSTSLAGSDDGMSIQADLGSSSSTSLFSGNDMALIQETLNFKLTGTLISGDTFEFEMPVEVAKVY